MRFFRTKILLSLLAVVVTSAGATVLFCGGYYPEGILALILLLCAMIYMITLVRKLAGVMSGFVAALEMHDTTMRYDEDCNNPDLRSMFRAMNRIATLYRSNDRKVETSRLYYDRILKVMTHEMRNGITPVMAIADDMGKHPAKYTGSNMTDAAILIKEQSEGISRFLDAYYRLTHIPSPKRESVDAVSFFNRIRTLLRSEVAERGLPESLCVFRVGKGMMLDIDVSLMTQVMMNMLRNALDAVDGVAEPLVEVTVSESEGHPYIRVADNGTGISPLMRDTLFQPFSTTKPAGCGVGLFLSRQIVRQHGGDLFLKDNAPEGAVAIITL